MNLRNNKITNLTVYNPPKLALVTCCSVMATLFFDIIRGESGRNFSSNGNLKRERRIHDNTSLALVTTDFAHEMNKPGLHYEYTRNEGYYEGWYKYLRYKEYYERCYKYDYVYYRDYHNSLEEMPSIRNVSRFRDTFNKKGTAC